MEPHPHPNPSAPGANLAMDRARWTPDKQRLFLASLLSTGNVTQAARIVSMSPASAHRLRRRLAGTPFDRSWANALALHAQSLADPFAGHPARPVTRQARG
ncbi:LysR family transcriptional regulator [Sphingobium sp. CR2-8]|uniref:LysR family transcriptional regulator n=1 Tax=Sphingobium sp. CR2-8 TaxID=1306534 RepID=UPI002DBC195D|nr:LysR family transcriptional regulator [Sphingobium sp. CR2-8]MEC3912053.1 LysR family transcriptional regulator [Sphingobium sp. CR2-8]